MIHYVKGNLLESDAQALVNTVNGGLDWLVVKRMIEQHLADLDCDIFLYEPSEVIIEKMKSERVKLTPARAFPSRVLFKLLPGIAVVG